MPLSPLVAYHDSAITSHGSLATSAQADLDLAQAALAAAEASAAAAVGAIADKLEERRAVQAQLALATSPAEVVPLAAQLETILLDLHHEQASLLAARTSVVTETAKIARAEAQIRRARAGVAAFTASKAEAEVRSALELGWKTVLASTAFTDAVAAGAAALVGATHASAKARVEADIPADLRTAARARAALVIANASAKAAAVQSKIGTLNTQLDTDGGLAAQVEKRTIAFEAARVALRDRSTQRPERIERAVRLLEGVVGSTALTASEAAGIAAQGAAIVAKQGEITTKQGEITTKQGEIAAKQAAVDAKQLALDADPGNVVLQGELATLQGELATLQGELVVLEAALTALQAALEVLVDRREAAVPDRAWANLDAFDEAERILTAETAADPAPGLSTTFDNAESALALALTAQLTNTLARALTAEEIAELTAVAERAAATELIFSALRGDD